MTHWLSIGRMCSALNVGLTPIVPQSLSFLVGSTCQFSSVFISCWSISSRGFSLSSSFDIIVLVVLRTVVVLPLTSPSVVSLSSFSISQLFVSQSSVSSSSVSLFTSSSRNCTVIGSLSSHYYLSCVPLPGIFLPFALSLSELS